MSIPEIILLALFLSSAVGFIGLMAYDQWKCSQAYNGVMEALQEGIVSISDSLSNIAFELTYLRVSDQSSGVSYESTES